MPTSRRPLFLTALAASVAHTALVAAGPSASRLAGLLAAAASLAWAVRRRQQTGAFASRIERWIVCLLACGAAWWALLIFALDHWVLFARGALWLATGLAAHAALVYAQLDPSQPKPPAGRVEAERHGRDPGSRPLLYGLVFLGVAAGTLAAIETVARVVSPLRTYEIVPDDPVAGLCLVRHRDGRLVGRPGCSGRYVHREFPGVTVEINALGLRDGLDEASAPDPGERSIVVLGDSFAFGLGVPLEATFQERLEDRLNEGPARATRVYGAGMPGAGAVDARLTLEELAPFARPDLILLALFEGNDLQDTWSRRGVASGVASPAPVRHRPREMAFLGSTLGWRFWRTSSSLLQLRRVDGTPTRIMEAALRTERPAEIEEMTDVLLEEIGDLEKRCRRIDAELVVLLVPTAVQAEAERFHDFTRRRHGESYDRLAFHHHLASELASRGITVVDPLDALEGEIRAGRPCYFREGHWNAHGHRVAADRLHEVVGHRGAPAGASEAEFRQSAVDILAPTGATEDEKEIDSDR